MTDEALKQRNDEQLATCWPAFANKIRAVISDMAGHGYRCRIQQSWRSPQEQLEAFNSGHSKLRFGFHNCTGPNGEKQALAVDLLDDDRPNEETMKYSLMLYSSAHSHGLTTGALYGLSPKMKQAFVNAALGKDWDNQKVKRGWDESHVDCGNQITPAYAKAGARI